MLGVGDDANALSQHTLAVIQRGLSHGRRVLITTQRTSWEALEAIHSWSPIVQKVPLGELAP